MGNYTDQDGQSYYEPEPPARPVEGRETEFGDLLAEREARIREDAFRSGVLVGRVQAETEHVERLDALVVEAGPSTYDAACRALDAAVRLVKPIDSAALMLDEEFGPVTSAYERLTIGLADGFVRWLSEHIEPGDVRDDLSCGSCGSCGRHRDDHAEGCLYGPKQKAEPFGPFGTAPGHDPNVTVGGCWPEHPCPSCQQRPVAPLPTEQQPCPECQAGKHDNCPGRVIDEQAETSPTADGPIRYRPCPCAGETHPESLG